MPAENGKKVEQIFICMYLKPLSAYYLYRLKKFNNPFIRDERKHCHFWYKRSQCRSVSNILWTLCIVTYKSWDWQSFLRICIYNSLIAISCHFLYQKSLYSVSLHTSIFLTMSSDTAFGISSYQSFQLHFISLGFYRARCLRSTADHVKVTSQQNASRIEVSPGNVRVCYVHSY